MEVDEVEEFHSRGPVRKSQDRTLIVLHQARSHIVRINAVGAGIGPCFDVNTHAGAVSIQLVPLFDMRAIKSCQSL